MPGKKNQWFANLSLKKKSVQWIIYVLHRMRVSFGFTLYYHGPFGVNNVLFH